MKRFLKIFFVFVLLSISTGCGEDVPIWTVVQFLDPHAGACRTLQPGLKYTMQVTFAEGTGAPIYDPPNTFKIGAIDTKTGATIGLFEGVHYSPYQNPYNVRAPASSFSFIYRTPDSISGPVEVTFEVFPALLWPEALMDCQILPPGSIP